MVVQKIKMGNKGGFFGFYYRRFQKEVYSYFNYFLGSVLDFLGCEWVVIYVFKEVLIWFCV